MLVTVIVGLAAFILGALTSRLWTAHRSDSRSASARPFTPPPVPPDLRCGQPVEGIVVDETTDDTTADTTEHSTAHPEFDGAVFAAAPRQASWRPGSRRAAEEEQRRARQHRRAVIADALNTHAQTPDDLTRTVAAAHWVSSRRDTP